MDLNIDTLPDDPAALKALLKEQRLKYLELEENYLALQRRFFGKSSEKLSEEDQKQLLLFNEAELEATDVDEGESEEPAQTTPVKEHSRKKAGRKPLSDKLPRVEIVHDLPEAERACSCCGTERPRIGQEESEELDIIPAQVRVLKHIKVKYGPCSCEDSTENEEPEVVTAKAPPRLIPGSIVSPGLLAYVLVSKFCDALPFYRQESMFKRIESDISRQNMSNWAMAASRACQGLLELMIKEIRGGPLVNMDETTVQVLREPDRPATTKSHMWVMRGGPPDRPLVVFQYYQKKDKSIPIKILDDFQGFLQTDGFRTYSDIGSREGIIHIGCFAHARRKFFDAAKASKKTGGAHQGLSFIQKLYEIEKKLRKQELEAAEFCEKRKESVLPVLADFKAWLDKKVVHTTATSGVGKAVHYTLSEWDKLVRYIESPIATPDNNAAENAIRPFVVGRKNWLFANTPRGAHASACIYSLIESAKANGLEPYHYLRYIFTKLPQVAPEDALHQLLPGVVDPGDFYSA